MDPCADDSRNETVGASRCASKAGRIWTERRPPPPWAAAAGAASLSAQSARKLMSHLLTAVRHTVIVAFCVWGFHKFLQLHPSTFDCTMRRVLYQTCTCYWNLGSARGRPLYGRVMYAYPPDERAVECAQSNVRSRRTRSPDTVMSHGQARCRVDTDPRTPRPSRGERPFHTAYPLCSVQITDKENKENSRNSSNSAVPKKVPAS